MQEVRRSHTVVDGTRYAFLEAGEGPLVLLGHGTFGGKELLRPQLERLSANFRCVALDWPGHGDSGWDPKGWSADDLVEDVAALVEAFGEHSAFLVGVSQGGAVFTRTALAHPGLVRGLVVMCAGPGVPPDAAVARMCELAGVLADEPDEAVRRHAAASFADAVFHAPGWSTREPERAAGEVDVLVGHPRAAVRLLAAVPASYASIAHRLGEIACPTLVVWADHDGRPHLGAEVAAAIPGATLAQIADAGHHVNVDAPEATSEAVERFLLALVA